METAKPRTDAGFSLCHLHLRAPDHYVEYRGLRWFLIANRHQYRHQERRPEVRALDLRVMSCITRLVITAGCGFEVCRSRQITARRAPYPHPIRPRYRNTPPLRSRPVPVRHSSGHPKVSPFINQRPSMGVMAIRLACAMSPLASLRPLRAL